MKIYNSITETIGETPIVRLNNIGPDHVNIYGKVEAFNPGGSVKDRLALNIIRDAEESGALRPGQTIVEATSGNTGIGLALVCAARGYPLVIVMAESFSVERRRLMRFMGARVILTPASEKGSGMVAKAEELARTHGWFLPRQFENQANTRAHILTTGPELVNAFRAEGKTLDYWVTGFGTAGTLQGVGRYLRQHSPLTDIVVCEPDNSRTLSHPVDENGLPLGDLESHPNFRPHAMQGWMPDFIPKLGREAVHLSLIDHFVAVDGQDALKLARDLATKEGLLAGITSGAGLAGALEIAKKAPHGSNIVVMLPDTGERYLSTPLFDAIEADMNADELAISRSSPSCQFGGAAAPVPHLEPEPDTGMTDQPGPVAMPAPAHKNDQEASNFIENAISDTNNPVVMFGHEWCEFCWSGRRMMDAVGIAHRTINMDSRDYQAGDLGRRVRAALSDKTGMATVPQIFIGGQFFGGVMDMFDAWEQGKLQQAMDAAHISYARDTRLDVMTFLPKWLQARQAS